MLGSKNWRNGPLATAALAAGLLIGAPTGCSAPEGDTGGRASVYDTTSAERQDGRANLASLTQLSDEAVTAIVQSVYDLPASAPTETQKWVFAVGDLMNKTGTPTTDFEMFQVRVRNGLINSKRMREHFIVIADPGRVQSLLNKFQGAPKGSLIQDDAGARGASAARYDPAKMYVLNGEFYEATRTGKSQYLLSFQIMHLGTGEIAMTKDMDLAQIRK